MADSLSLDEADQKNNPENLIIPTDGGRFDVNIRERKKAPVYWTGDATEVRRCSWFYKGVDSRFVPYDEGISDLLEHEFEEASINGDWHRRISLPNGELVVFHDANVIVHFQQTTADNSWGQTQVIFVFNENVELYCKFFFCLF